MQKIAIYGKGGIGKSTTVSNMAAVLADEGTTVMQVGCDPKADSTVSLRGDTPLVPVMDTYRKKVNQITLEDMYVIGYKGVICVEAGGPTPGLGCAGRGVAKALELLNEKDAFKILKPDVVFLDVLGDVVCGGFSMPLRRGFSDKVYIISSGEQMAMHAAMNLGLALEDFERRGHVGLSGVIANLRNVPDEKAKIDELCEDLRCPLIGTIPNSPDVKKASDDGLTVLEADPGSPMIKIYGEIAHALIGE